MNNIFAEDISKLKARVEELETVETKELTLTKYIDENSVDMNVCTKIGKVAQVDFRAKIKEDVVNNATFLKLPFPANHSMVIHFGIGGRYNSSEMRWGYLTKDGQIRDGEIKAGNYIHVSFVYITQ